MDTNQISDIILKSMCERGFSIFLTNAMVGGLHEADVLGLNRSLYLYEYEIKQSRSDFKADFKKLMKHNYLRWRDTHRTYVEKNETRKIMLIPNRFFYACEVGLIKKEEVPEYAGLVHITDTGGIRVIKAAPLLHKERPGDYFYRAVASTLSQRMLYGCSYLTHVNNENAKKNKEFLNSTQLLRR